jgi:hypothetical protein
MKDIPDSLREVSLFLYYATQESVTLWSLKRVKSVFTFAW